MDSNSLTFRNLRKIKICELQPIKYSYISIGISIVRGKLFTTIGSLFTRPIIPR